MPSERLTNIFLIRSSEVHQSSASNLLGVEYDSSSVTCLCVCQEYCKYLSHFLYNLYWTASEIVKIVEIVKIRGVLNKLLVDDAGITKIA